MNTAKMKHLEKMDSATSYRLLQMAKKLQQSAQEVQEILEKSFLREQIVEVVEAYYYLGQVVDAYEIFGGYINRSFGIVVEKDGERKHYFLRKYKLGVTDSEIRFEHAMITHSIAHGLSICAALIHAQDGETFVSPANISRNKFAIYEFLEGEDKYTWDNPIMEDEEYASSAQVLATFHHATRNFDPRGLARVEPGIIELVSALPDTIRQYAQQPRNTKFFAYFSSKMDGILSAIAANVIPAEDIPLLPVNAIHCDFHPGNLKFADNRAVGVFDFDWAKIDLRLFDVCLALVYNSTIWGGRDDGTMLLDKCRIFLKAYQNTLAGLQGLSPLNHIELKYFPVMMAMGNFYLINWDLTTYFSETDLNDYEYLAYLKHNVRLMEWIEKHKQEFVNLADSININ